MVLDRIIIIDDNENHLQEASNYLKNEGFDVAVEKNPKLAQKRLLTEDFDLVLMKFKMSHFDGLTIMESLQKQGSKSSFIIMAESLDIKQSLKIMQEGAYSILMIPYKKNQLKEMVVKALQNKHAFLEILQLSDNLTLANKELKDKKKILEDEQRLLKNKIEALNFLNGLSSLMSSSLNPETIIDSLIQNLLETVPFDIFSVMIADEKEIFFKIHSDSQLEKEFMDDVNINIHKSFAKYMGETIHLKSMLKKNGNRSRKVLRIPFGAELNFNLEVAGRKLGVLKIIRFSREPFSKDHKSLLNTVSNQLALSLNNALEHKKFLGLAAHDCLTKTLNRRAFDEIIEREFNRSVRYKTPLSVVMMDLDHFKKVNDSRGHLAGDIVLKEVAETISKCLREIDIFARYGGEEFVIILPQTNIEKACIMAERIRKAIECFSVYFEEGEIKVTLSMGIASYPFTPAKDKNDLVNLADNAMYQAKKNGRNRIYIHSQNKEFCEIKLEKKAFEQMEINSVVA